MMTDPSAADLKLTVVVLAYNQKALFRQAIESVVTQQVNFRYEILVCDDASTDGTTDVVREYAERYPDLIRALYRERNAGQYLNYVDAHNRARGQYVAHLDGDDLFLPGKLQQQVDFLDRHPQVSVCWHAVGLIDADGRDLGRICVREAIAPDGYIDLVDLLEIGTVGVHSATMYRASARKTHEPTVDPIDWFYAVEYLASGRGYQMAEELGCYRRMEGLTMSSESASARRVRRNLANMIEHYVDVFPQYRRQSFTLAMLYLLCDIRARATTVTAMLAPMWAARVPPTPAQFRRALHRFRAVSRAFRGLPREGGGDPAIRGETVGA